MKLTQASKKETSAEFSTKEIKMQQLLVTHQSVCTTHRIIEIDTAKKAYETIKIAMAAYRLFSNDKVSTVSVSLGGEDETTIRLEGLNSISLSLSNPEKDEAFMAYGIEMALKDAKIKRILEQDNPSPKGEET